MYDKFKQQLVWFGDWRTSVTTILNHKKYFIPESWPRLSQEREWEIPENRPAGTKESPSQASIKYRVTSPWLTGWLTSEHYFTLLYGCTTKAHGTILTPNMSLTMHITAMIKQIMMHWTCGAVLDFTSVMLWSLREHASRSSLYESMVPTIEGS